MDDFFAILATVRYHHLAARTSLTQCIKVFSIGVTIAIGYESKLGVLSRAGLKVSYELEKIPP